MSVASDQRRFGVGVLLAETLIDTARAWGVSQIVLETSSGWSDVIAFYLRCGFSITHVSVGEFGEDTWFERVLQNRSLMSSCGFSKGTLAYVPAPITTKADAVATSVGSDASWNSRAVSRTATCGDAPLVSRACSSAM